MVNWLMGHNHSPLDFRAFVSHDGIFNTVQCAYSTEELYFPEHDNGGTPVQNRAVYEKFNPMNFVGDWKTPCLVIHSRKDCMPHSLPLCVSFFFGDGCRNLFSSFLLPQQTDSANRKG
jgi:dipeptidyl aminopeptidase/acylaminoacyl peptidase